MLEKFRDKIELLSIFSIGYLQPCVGALNLPAPILVTHDMKRCLTRQTVADSDQTAEWLSDRYIRVTFSHLLAIRPLGAQW